jgi:hypothetical protein
LLLNPAENKFFMMMEQGVLVGLTLGWSFLTCPAEVTVENIRINPPSNNG